MLIKGFLEQTNVLMSNIKFKCLEFEPEVPKEFNADFNQNLEIRDIKGFRLFLRTTKRTEFKVGEYLFKKEDGKLRTHICMYKDKKIFSLNADYLKPIFRELKYLSKLKIYYKDNESYPVYFELNKKDGFLLAPCIMEED